MIDNSTYLEETVTVYDATLGETLIVTPFTKDLVENNKYVVTINGVDYETSCKAYQIEGNVVLLLGNAAYAGDANDTGEPFVLYKMQGLGASDATGDGNALYAVIVDCNTESDFTVSSVPVSVRGAGTQEIVHPIERKFLTSLRGQKTFDIQVSSFTQGATCTALGNFYEAWQLDDAE